MVVESTSYVSTGTAGASGGGGGGSSYCSGVAGGSASYPGSPVTQRICNCFKTVRCSHNGAGGGAGGAATGSKF